MGAVEESLLRRRIFFHTRFQDAYISVGSPRDRWAFWKETHI